MFATVNSSLCDAEVLSYSKTFLYFQATLQVKYSRNYARTRSLEMSPMLRQSEDEEWNTETPILKQWDDEDPIPDFRQSENDDWNRDLRLRQSEDEDWSQYMQPTEHESFSEFSKKAKAVSRIMMSVLPHINHRLEISVSAEPLSSTAYLLMDYNHTYDKLLNIVRLQAVSKRANDETPYEVSTIVLLQSLYISIFQTASNSDRFHYSESTFILYYNKVKKTKHTF